MSRILVSDDDRQNLYMLRILLEGHGFQVETVADGRAALDSARAHPPDLVISDILMPVMDGFILCSHWMMDEDLRTVPFIFYTATYTETKDKEFALSLGASAFIVKPAEPEILLAAIRATLDSSFKGPLVAAKPPIEELPFLKTYNERLIAKLEDKMMQLEQANQHLTLLYTASTNLAAVKPVHQLISHVLGAVVDQFGYAHANYFTLDEARQEFRMLVATGYPEATVERLRRELVLKMGEERGLVGLVGRTRRPLAVPDTRLDPRWISLDQSLLSALFAPVQYEGRLLGVVAFFSKSAGAFAAEHGRDMMTLANNVAIAVENAVLYETQQQNAKQLQRIMDTVPDGLILLNAEHKVVLANPRAQDSLRLLADGEPDVPLTHLGGVPISELLLPPPRGVLSHELVLDGPSKRIFELSAHLIEEDHLAEGWVVVLREVTRERSQQQYEQAQAQLATVGQLSAGIAHDFNNIMGVIGIYSQMLQRNPDLSPKEHGFVNTIYEQSLHAANLTQQILDFSRRSIMERRPISLVPFVKEMIKLWERTMPENIRFGLNYSENELIVNVDPTRIQQVLMNLGLNARDAMSKRGGTLTFDLNRLVLTADEVPPLPDIVPGTWVTMAISDSGSGIPAENLKHVFEPFFTTKGAGKGTGLGLAQVYGIVKQHGGHIDVSSQAGLGTSFVIYLPALSISEFLIDQPDPGTAVMGHGEIILLVEDAFAMRGAIGHILEALNYKMMEAADGAEALELFGEHHPDIALVLSDIVMPDIGGIALAGKLKAIDPGVKIVLTSGYGLEVEEQDLANRGIVAMVQKPFDEHRIATVLRDVLRP